MFKNILWVMVILIPVVIFYYINRGVFGIYVISQALPGPLWDLVPSQRRNLVSLQSAAFYFKIFEQLNIFFFVLFIAGLFLGIRKIKKYGLFILGFLLPYLIFSFASAIKSDRYIIPIYPFIALVSSVVVEEIERKIKIYIVFIISVLCVFSFLGCIWGIGPLSTGLQSMLIPMPFGHPRRIHISSMVWPPTKEFSNAETIMDILSKDVLIHNKKNPQILNLFSYHPLDNALFSINNYEMLDKFTFQNFVGTSPNAEFAVDSLAKTDYLLIKSGKSVDNYFSINNYVLLESVVHSIFEHKDYDHFPFKKIATVFEPLDKSNVTIYRRVGEMSRENKEEIKKIIEVNLQ